MTDQPFVSGCCEGEKCFCGAPAAHKIEETIFHDDPVPHRHPLTAYICHEHFRMVMGPAADCRARAPVTLSARPLLHTDGRPVVAGDLKSGEAFDFDPNTMVIRRRSD